MKKVLLTVVTVLAVSTGAIAADFIPKNDASFQPPPPKHPKVPRHLVENNDSYSSAIIGGHCGSFSCGGGGR